jgi:hypothetical protein
MQTRGLLAAMFAATMLMAASVQAAGHAAPGGMTPGKMVSSSMTADKDGMVTKDEFMKKMGAMWDKMDKEKKGKVAMADIERFFNNQTSN